MQDALNALAVAVLLMLAGLIPYLGAAAKAALVTFTESKHRGAITGAAETLAAVAARVGASATERSVAAQVEHLKARVPDAVAALAPSDSTLRDILTKAAATVAAGALAR